jgi:hypothetical protein
MNKIILPHFSLNNSVLFIILFAVFTASLPAQTPQYYNYNTGTSINTFPFGQTVGKEVQWLIRAHELNQPSQAQPGVITTVYFWMGNTATVTFTDLLIKLGRTTLTSLPTGQIYTGLMDTVYFRTSVTLSSINSTWMRIQLDRYWHFDTAQSLVVDVSQCGASASGMYVRQTTLTPVRRNYINHTGNCVFVYSGQDGAEINFGVDVTLPNLCEGFSSTTFPPVNWTITGGTANHWSRYNVSGYGLGAGSARFNGWTAADIEDLTTLLFVASPPNYSLQFDFAYAPWPANPPYQQDSLLILASTNGGTTYSTILSWGPLQLQTAPATNSEFVPNADQWGLMRVTLPAGTNRIAFRGHGDVGNDFFIDSACVVNLVNISNNHNSLPAVYSLAQNYPNPFNPVTKIEYAIPKPGNVKLIIYDVLGREVTVLVNEMKQSGYYSVSFDASIYPSGVYFYRLESGDFKDVKKMVLIK